MKAPPIEVHIFTDGSCYPNPGPGGWAAILLHVETRTEKEVVGKEVLTTNNRMELFAVIAGMQALTRPAAIRVFSDSRYVTRLVGKWNNGEHAHSLSGKYEQNNWRKGDGNFPANLDMLKLLTKEAKRHLYIDCEWIRGHTGHDYNERCDELAGTARKAAAELKRETNANDS